MGKHYYQFDVLDYSEETSGSKVHFGVVNIVNFGVVLGMIGSLRTAITNLTKGVLRKDMWVGDSDVYTNTPPVDPTAQVELALRFKYEGATSKKQYRIHVPCADAAVCLPNSDEVDLAHTDVAAFVTAFEALVKSPDDEAEAVLITGMNIVE